MLEGYTYLHTIKNPQRVFDDFKLKRAKRLATCPLVAQGDVQHKEMWQNRPKLKELMGMLDVKPIYYAKKVGEYKYCFEGFEKIYKEH